jgi:hypothetical protein
MSCTLRKSDEPYPDPNRQDTRIRLLRSAICGGDWTNRNDICLLYWRKLDGHPNGGEWAAWVDQGRREPFEEADITVLD